MVTPLNAAKRRLIERAGYLSGNDPDGATCLQFLAMHALLRFSKTSSIIRIEPDYLVESEIVLVVIGLAVGLPRL